MANIITPPKTEKVSNNMTIEQYIAHLLFLLFFGLFGVCMAQWGQNVYEVALNFLGQFIRAHTSRVSNMESDTSQNVGLEDYNNISVGIFPHFTTPSIRISLG